MIQSFVVQPLTAPHVSEAAEHFAPMPLFALYGRSADDLARKWHAAIAEGAPPLVARDGKSFVGLCWFAGKGGFATGGYLRLLIVHESAQRRGVGRALMRAYEDACAPAAGGWFLLVNETNAAAQAFYASCGYERVGRIPHYLVPNQHELIYWKPLLRHK